jgi:hypothetical protein
MPGPTVEELQAHMQSPDYVQYQREFDSQLHGIEQNLYAEQAGAVLHLWYGNVHGLNEELARFNEGQPHRLLGECR